MRSFLVGLLFLLTKSIGMDGVGYEQGSFLVKKIEKPAMVSGIHAAWVVVWVDSKSTGEFELYFPYVSPYSLLPEAGTKCNFVYYHRDINGYAGVELVNIAKAKVIHSFECE